MARNSSAARDRQDARFSSHVLSTSRSSSTSRSRLSHFSSTGPLVTAAVESRNGQSNYSPHPPVSGKSTFVLFMSSAPSPAPPAPPDPATPPPNRPPNKTNDARFP